MPQPLDALRLVKGLFHESQCSNVQNEGVSQTPSPRLDPLATAHPIGNVSVSRSQKSELEP